MNKQEREGKIWAKKKRETNKISAFFNI